MSLVGLGEGEGCLAKAGSAPFTFCASGKAVWLGGHAKHIFVEPAVSVEVVVDGDSVFSEGKIRDFQGKGAFLGRHDPVEKNLFFVGKIGRVIVNAYADGAARIANVGDLDLKRPGINGRHEQYAQ